jgi:hypothetical protein
MTRLRPPTAGGAPEALSAAFFSSQPCKSSTTTGNSPTRLRANACRSFGRSGPYVVCLLDQFAQERNIPIQVLPLGIPR